MRQLQKVSVLLVMVLAVGCGTDDENTPNFGVYQPMDPLVPGESSFVTGHPAEDPNSYGGHYADAGMAGSADAGAVAPTDPVAPSGREAEVEEAEIYRVHDDKLFFLNTYRGLLVYDIADESKPELLARVGVYGVPTEMYFKGDIAYVLVRDALYLTQSGDSPPTFQRHNVSQLLTIDFSDVKAPKIIGRFDIEGLLREGLSRKVEDTIYVVSERPSWYYSSGWSGQSGYGEEEVHVHSFNVSDPKQAVEIDRLQLLSGGGKDDYNWENGWDQRSFLGVAISATSNALMVAERWSTTN
ncbi:MAG: beta-propeller domain-containing protein, partial [Deltaproteobacteria bacterium]|nr:beta-propeller domain-containing protein [Deltaproteobacteria bacterium]